MVVTEVKRDEEFKGVPAAVGVVVVGVDGLRGDGAAGEAAGEAGELVEDHVDAGGFKRLNESKGVAEGDDIADPAVLMTARFEGDDALVVDGLAMLLELGEGFIVRDVLAGEDVAEVIFMLHGSVPKPTVVESGGGGVGEDFAGVFAAAKDGAIGEEAGGIVDPKGSGELCRVGRK